jgi:hypothetical protein
LCRQGVTVIRNPGRQLREKEQLNLRQKKDGKDGYQRLFQDGEGRCRSAFSFAHTAATKSWRGHPFIILREGPVSKQ